MNPTGYIIAWLFAVGPVFYLGLVLGGKMTDWKLARCQQRPCDNPHHQRCEHRECVGCGALYHESWNGPGEKHLCANCSGAT